MRCSRLRPHPVPVHMQPFSSISKVFAIRPRNLNMVGIHPTRHFFHFPHFSHFLRCFCLYSSTELFSQCLFRRIEGSVITFLNNAGKISGTETGPYSAGQKAAFTLMDKWIEKLDRKIQPYAVDIKVISLFLHTALFPCLTTSLWSFFDRILSSKHASALPTTKLAY